MRWPRVLALLVLGGCLLSGVERALAAPDLEVLAGQIAKSIDMGLRNPKYQTVAFSRIKQAGSDLDVNTLIDYTNVRLVQGQRLRVVDRSKLQLILQEQQIQTSDFVSAQKYQELGKLAGVDLFIYGTLYRDALVLKAIDVQTSALAWADSFPVTDPAPESQTLASLGQETVASMQQALPRLQRDNVHLVSFWSVDTGGLFPPEEVMDELSVAITK
ncbi:MAG TPA: CsgG/HfaB family protein, partial [bacterium]|nr:CsgG/HfaB family protein [bacterium]